MYKIGDKICWDLEVHNYGPNDNTNVELTDLLPTGLSFLSLEEFDGTNWIDVSTGYNAVTGKYVIGNLSNGNTKKYRICAEATQTGTFINEASVSGDNIEIDNTNNSDSDTVIIEDNIPQCVSTGITNYVIEIRSAQASNTLYQTITETTTSIDPVISGWVSATGLNDAPNLPVFTVNTNALPGNIRICYISTTDNCGTTMLNDCALYEQTQADADLQLTKTVNNNQAAAGDTITYTITVTNNGPDTVYGFSVTDVLDNLNLDTSSATNINASVGTAAVVGPPVVAQPSMLWSSGNIVFNSGDSATLTFDISILPTASGQIINTAQVSPGNPSYNDTVPSNNIGGDENGDSGTSTGIGSGDATVDIVV